MDQDKIWLNLCKNVKSTDEYEIEFIEDGSGILFFKNGFKIKFNYKNRNYVIDYDLFPLFEVDYEHEDDWWSWAKSCILEDEFEIQNITDTDPSNPHYYKKLTEEEYNDLKDIWYNIMKHLVQQIEGNASRQNINLAKLFFNDDEEE